MDYESRIRLWLMQDEMRLEVIKAVASLNIPDCWVAAGFIRNLVWDKLHDYAYFTPLNDIDVVYYDAQHTDRAADYFYESQLRALTKKSLGFSVKNQARMHYKLQKAQYINTLQAMSFWPEIETAVGVRWIDNSIQLIAPFGLERLFDKTITFNVNSSLEAFKQRIKSKGWLETWPDLIVNEKGQ